jgi:hypothetical protein
VGISGGSHARVALPAKEFVGDRKKHRTNEIIMVENSVFITITSFATLSEANRSKGVTVFARQPYFRLL